MHCHASRSKSCQAAMLSAESCFTVKASEPERNLCCGNAAGHEPKEKACRSARGWSNVYICISRVKSPQNVCQGWFEESRQAQAGIRPLRHKADRLVTAALLWLFAGDLKMLQLLVFA